MKKITATIIMLVSSYTVAAQSPSSNPNERLQLFSNVQTTCKIMILNNSEIAKSIVIGTRRSLTDICECAALLTITSMSDGDVSNILTGEKEEARNLLKLLSENVVSCVQIQ
jgi:hypothetical protein